MHACVRVYKSRRLIKIIKYVAETFVRTLNIFSFNPVQRLSLIPFIHSTVFVIALLQVQKDI